MGARGGMVIGCAVGVALLIAGRGAFGQEGADGKAGGHTGFALVELYTSEGCHSCPPADDVAANISRRAESLGERVYVVSFHVDYWDRLGWPDRFADGAYTARQRAYAEAFENRNVYTPQMVVNGTTEFVGSRRAQADEAIEAARGVDAGAELTIDVLLRADLRSRAVCTVEGLDEATAARAVVHFAQVEDGLETEVEAGENAGKTLRHEDVVRWFESVALRGRERAQVIVPESVHGERASLVVWVQDGEVGRVLGAGRWRGRRVVE